MIKFGLKFFQGGIKAVVHTDAWQVMVMFLSVVGVVVCLAQIMKINVSIRLS